MTHSLPILDIATEDAELEPRSWLDTMREAVVGGGRPVTLWGRADGASVLVTAVLQDADGQLRVWRTRLDPKRGYQALTASFPAFHCFERELHEQTGMRIAGHPWLKPIRFESMDPAEIDAYPFYAVEGKEVHEVAVGPIHAGVIEPGAFRFMCHGEDVLHLEIHLGYQHRAVEKGLLRAPPLTLAPFVETIAGDTSVAHTWAYARSLELLTANPAVTTGVIDAHQDRLRGLLLELERIAMHLAGLAGLAADVGYQFGAAVYGRLRTTAINASMRLTGSRFGRGAIRPGVTRCRLDAATLAALDDAMSLLERDCATMHEAFLGSRTVRHRLRGVGTVSCELARKVGLVGLAARASGVALDQRGFRGGLYEALPFDPVVAPSGDCWARALIRTQELTRSLAWIRALRPALASGSQADEQRAPAPSALRASRLVVVLCEGWRGEVVHALETGPSGHLVHYKVQDPSLRNWLGLALALRGNAISDFPICNKSFDLSYCGNDL